jgi:hypothetical protein
MWEVHNQRQDSKGSVAVGGLTAAARRNEGPRPVATDMVFRCVERNGK